MTVTVIRSTQWLLGDVNAHWHTVGECDSVRPAGRRAALPEVEYSCRWWSILSECPNLIVTVSARESSPIGSDVALCFITQPTLVIAV